MNDFPHRIVLGTVTPWAVTLPAYSPVDGCSAQLIIKPSGVAPVVVDSLVDPDNSAFSFEIPADIFPADTHEKATCQLFVISSPASRYFIASGNTFIFPDLANVAADFDPRTHNQRVLDAICAVLEDRASDVESEIEVGGAVPRKLKLLSPAQLLQFRNDYERRVEEEQEAEYIATGGKTYDYLATRFINA